MDVLEVRAAFESQNGVDCQVGEVVFVLGEDLGADGGPGDVQQVFFEEF